MDIEAAHPCCCCLLRPPYKDINLPYKYNGKIEVYSAMIKECFEIHLYGGNACSICEACVWRLRDAHEFKLRVQGSQAKLRAQEGALHVKEENITVKIEPDDDGRSNDTVIGLVPTTGEGSIELDTHRLAYFKAADYSSRRKNVKLEPKAEAVQSYEDCAPSPQTASPPPHTRMLYKEIKGNIKVYSKRRSQPISDNRQPETNPVSTTHLNINNSQKSSESSKSTILSNGSKRKRIRREGPFTCDVCNKQFKLNIYLTIHKRSHTGERPYACDLCPKRFFRRNALTVHRWIHTGEKPHCCTICQTKFGNRQNLLRHMKIHTGDKPHACDLCDKRFIQKTAMAKHMSVHTGEKPYRCAVCDKRFSYKHTVKSHEAAHVAGRAPPADGPFVCQYCNKKFSFKANLMIHIRKHTGEKPYVCEVCGKAYSQKSAFNIHLLIHTGLKLFQCKVCGKKFANLSNKSRHERSHAGDKPYQCDLCGNRYTAKNNLGMHMATHTGVKPYACEVCRKKFSEKSYLVRHKVTHTGVVREKRKLK